MISIGDAQLLCSDRLYNRGADVIGRYDVYLKTVLLFLVQGFPSTLVCWIFLSRSHFLGLYEKRYIGIGGIIVYTCINMHSMNLTSPTVKEDTGCNDISLHKLLVRR